MSILTPRMNSDGSVQLQNENLKNIDVDFLYHFGIDNKTTNLEKTFGDVNFVVMGGSEGRMESFAKALYNHLKGEKTCPNIVEKRQQTPSL